MGHGEILLVGARPIHLGKLPLYIHMILVHGRPCVLYRSCIPTYLRKSPKVGFTKTL